MHTVVETPVFLAAAAMAGISDEEIEAMTDVIAADPMAGDEIKGTGGCRKIRVAGRGKGKSGGYRVLTFYSGEDIPVFLIGAYGKGQKANITPAEANTLKAITKLIVQTYKRRPK